MIRSERKIRAIINNAQQFQSIIAEADLQMAGLYKAFYAVLKERSPSCGHGEIYDGTFSQTLMAGNGITAKLLEENGIRVYGESELESLLMDLEEVGDLLPVDNEYWITEILDDADEYYMDLFEEEFGFEECYISRTDKKSRINKAGKNHIRINGQLLQTNKKYSALKNKQKEKIASWMREEIRRFYDRTGEFPYKKYNSQVVDAVYDRIQEANIWIPYGEVAQEFGRKKQRMIKSVQTALDREKDTKEQERVTYNEEQNL